MRFVSKGTVVLMGIVLLASPGVGAAKEAAKGGPWASEAGAPAWVTAPPAKAEAIRVVIASQSNLLELADGFHARLVAKKVAAELAWRLRGLLAEQSDAVLSVHLRPANPVMKAYHLTPARRGDSTPGGQVYTVWTLFEVSEKPVLDAIPAAKREAARAALALAEPSDTPAWETPASAPSWVAKVPVKPGVFSTVVEFSADRVDVAKAKSSTLAGEHVASRVAESLRLLLGEGEALRVGTAAATWRRCSARAVSAGPERTTAWALYEIPVARIVAAASEDKREAVRAIFEPGEKAK